MGLPANLTLGTIVGAINFSESVRTGSRRRSWHRLVDVGHTEDNKCPRDENKKDAGEFFMLQWVFWLIILIIIIIIFFFFHSDGNYK